MTLQIQPGLRIGPEIAPQSQRGIDRDCTLAVDNLVDPPGRNADGLGQRILAEPQRRRTPSIGVASLPTVSRTTASILAPICRRYTPTMMAADRNSTEKIRKLMAGQDDIRLSIVFGSVAGGTQTPESDLDIAVLADGPLTTGRKKTLIQSLAQLSGRPVDLIDLSTAGEPLLGRILQQGRRLTGTDSRWTSLVTRHLLDAADFLPYRNRMLMERRKAWTQQ